MTSQNQEDQEVFECSGCNSTVKQDDEFCPECGALFNEGIKCSSNAHSKFNAEGVCVICCFPFCERCGENVNGRFLCHAHSGYEIYQGMARVFGDLDDTNAQYVRSCLEQAGLHPIIFSKIQPKGGSRLVSTLFEAHGDPYGNIVNEVKVMVSCQEVVSAEQILRELKIII